MEIQATISIPITLNLPDEVFNNIGSATPEVIMFDQTQENVIIDLTTERLEKFSAFPNIIVMSYNNQNNLEPWNAPQEAEVNSLQIPQRYIIHTNRLKGLIILKK